MRVGRHWGLITPFAYAACLFGATVNHARIVARHGFDWDYGGVPAASAVFWTSLTLPDLLAFVMLIVRPKAGVAATAIIIIADVVHNVWITSRYAGLQGFIGAAVSDPFLVSQFVFLLFVLAPCRPPGNALNRPTLTQHSAASNL